MYKIPRIGTAIIVTPAVSYPALGGHVTCQKHVNTLSKFKSVRIKWNKQKVKFEIGEKEPGPMPLYEN